MLTVQLPPQSCRSIHFGFLGGHPSCKPRKFSGRNVYSSTKHPSQEARKEPFCNEDVNESVKETHSILRGIHQSIFEEQVFDLVNRETFYSSPGVYVTGMREDYLQLGIGQETSAYLCLESSAEEDANKTIDSNEIQSGEGGVAHFDSLELMIVEEKQDALERNLLGLPNPSCYEIYLQYILHENIFLRAKERQTSSAKPQVSSQFAGDGLGLLGHFCMTIAHRIFSNKVLSEMENLVSGVPYLHLLSHPTWHSRTSSWSLTMKVPQSVLHAGRHAKLSDIHETRSGVRLQFHTKVVVNDEYISISGEGTPTIIGSFDGSSTGTCLLNCYGCDLAGLPTILLQQVASQVIRWLHEEALVVGMKASMEFLCLYFELDQGEKLGLAAHVNPENAHGRITWWLVMDDGSTEEGKLHADSSRSESENRFLGHLSLEALYSTLMDLVSLCCSGGSC